MKPVGPRAVKTLGILTEGVDKPGDSQKVDNAPDMFMPVSVECISECKDGQIYSVTHYYEQNGDLMRDPDMEFLRGVDGGWYPLSFWQDAPLIRDEAIKWTDKGEIEGVRTILQARLVTFANTWMRSISSQQGLVGWAKRRPQVQKAFTEKQEGD